MSSDEPAYTVSSATQAKVVDLYNRKDYPAAYQAVADDLKAQAARGVPIDPNTLTWYSDAAQINDAHANSFIHDFVRAYVSDYAQLTQQKPIDDEQFQYVSNQLAVRVLEPVVKHGQVDDFNVVGAQDTKNAVKGFKRDGVPVDQYAWPAYADLASFPWLRNFKNATWLNNLTPVEQRNILLAANMAGQTALWKSRGNGLTPADILNSVSLDEKLRAVEGELALHEGDLALHHVMNSALAIYGSLQHSAAALEGKSVLERLRHYAAQARADAAKKPVTPAMQLHQNLMDLIQQHRSYAPVPNRAGGPARPAAGDKGAWAAPQPAGAQPSSSSPQQRMDAMLKNLSPAQVEALNAHGAAALNQAGTDQAAASGAPFQLAEALRAIGMAPPGLPPGFFEAIANSPASMASRFAAIGLASSRLPSVAPCMAPGSGAARRFHGAMQPDEAAVAPGAPGAAQTTGFRAQVPDGAVDAPGAGFGPSAAARQHSLKRALQDYFDQQARLPPNGATGFDPLLTPAWPSLQLPA